MRKSERIVSQKQIDALFTGAGSHTKAAFPVRVIFSANELTQGQPPVQIMVSVPKRRLRHAVERNRVKRQIREAYRKNKHLLYDNMPHDRHIDLAFIWLADKTFPSHIVEERVKNLLPQIREK